MIEAAHLLNFFPERLRTSDVGALLRAMVESGDWSTIPLLVDAMRDAGATEEELRLPFQARDYVLTMKALEGVGRAAREAGQALANAVLPAFRTVAEQFAAAVASVQATDGPET